MDTTTQKLLLIDGNALMHRAYHAIPYLTTASGEQVNAVFGFTSIFLRSLSDLQPDYVVFTFDRPTPTFRHKLYEDYKATRQKMEDDLANQIPRLKEVVGAFGFPVYELDGYEADDLIGTIASQAYHNDKQSHTYILTADMDATQLVNERVSIYTAKQKISEVMIYDIEGVKTKYNGLRPNQIIDYKALKGDPSDNIPGVAGIGDKTATDLLLKYHTLDGIYQHIDELKPRAAKLLMDGQESALLSKQLATIDTQAPIELNLEDCRMHRFNHDKIAELFHELEFRSLINKLPQNLHDKSTVQQPKADTSYQLIDTVEAAEKLGQKIKDKGVVAFDTETTGVNIWDSELVGVSCSYDVGSGFYIPFTENAKPSLQKWLEDSSIVKIAHNGKFDSQAMAKVGIHVKSLTFDTMLAAYILKDGVGRYGLKELAFSDLGISATPITEVIGNGSKQLTIDQAPLDKVVDYAAADADHTWQLYQKYSNEFDHRLEAKKLFTEIEMPTSEVLARMESKGIKLDVQFLQQMSTELSGRLGQLEKSIYAAAGHEFNINSPKQLSEVLFDELHLPSSKKTKTGRSTNESVLQDLKGAHDIIDYILEYRELFKLKSTYVDALPLLVSQHDQRLHTSYNQAVAATGRLSSSNPNLQNIPIKTEIGRKIRQAFLPDEGHILLSIDYSQIELRILAHMAQDQNLLEAFRQGQDIHAATAAKVFDCQLDQVTSQQRRAAKTINFGIMYGQSAFGLSQQLGISREEASRFIQDYFSVYSAIKEYIDASIKGAHQNGYVETLFGRRRRVPELSAKNFVARQAAERMAFNMPIQGTAADIMKKAMIDIDAYMSSINCKSKMLLQVHDELVFSIDPSEEAQLIPEIKRHMESTAKLSVKLVAEAKQGINWGEMQDIEFSS